VVGNGVHAAVAAGHAQHHHAADHGRADQRDHQPDDRLPPGGGGQVVVVVVVAHWIGPKKLLSTCSRALPSSASITNRSGWRPWMPAGADTCSGSDSTCCGCACTCSAGPPCRARPSTGDSMRTV